MPSRRRVVQQLHERFHICLFLDALNHRYGAKYSIESEPNPPEAIIRSRRTVRWVEVVSAFWNAEYARDLYSYATDGEVHKSIGMDVFMNMTPKFAVNFASAVRQKFEKASYEPFRDRYGPGYLVVPILFPFFGPDALPFMQREWFRAPVQDRGCFRSVYLTYKVFDGEYRVSRWQPKGAA